MFKLVGKTLMARDLLLWFCQSKMFKNYVSKNIFSKFPGLQLQTFLNVKKNIFECNKHDILSGDTYCIPGQLSSGQIVLLAAVLVCEGIASKTSHPLLAWPRVKQSLV